MLRKVPVGTSRVCEKEAALIRNEYSWERGRACECRDFSALLELPAPLSSVRQTAPAFHLSTAPKPRQKTRAAGASKRPQNPVRKEESRWSFSTPSIHHQSREAAERENQEY